MLRILIANPMQFTRVSAVPFSSVGTTEATILENCGESAVTAIPHKTNAVRKMFGENENSTGEIKQNVPDMTNETTATFLLP